MTELRLLNPADILDSPTQPRRRNANKGLETLTESVREKGVLEPLLVRIVNGLPECVFGHRRKLAAVGAGVDTVPCIVRDLSDDQVLEAQLIENIEREDMHPLDEADGFASLIKRGYDVARIAGKIGRPVAYVAQRLKLCSLSKEARAALDAESISLGVALLIAKLPTAKIQAEALDRVGGGRSFGVEGLMSVADAREEIEQYVMLKLGEAPFDRADGELVPSAGPCTTCPKRTGMQTELFGDASSPDLCTDPVCYRGKLDALWKIRTKRHKDAGGEVLSQKDAEEVLHRVGYTGSDYVRLDSKHYPRGGGKARTIKQLFGKEPPPIVLARDKHSGLPVELVARKDADAAIRKAEPAEKKSVPTTTAERTREAAAKRERLKQRIRIETTKRITAKLVEAFQKRCADGKVSAAAAELLARCTVSSTWSDVGKKLCERRGLDPKKAKNGSMRRPVEELLNEYAEGKPPAELLGLVFELLIGRSAPSTWNDGADLWVDACTALKVDAKAIRETVAAEFRAAVKARGKSKRALKRTAVTPVDDDGADDVSTCRVCGCTDMEACEGGCTWVEDDLCSKCNSKGRPQRGRKRSREKATPATAQKAAG